MAPFRAKSSGGGSGLRRAGDDAFKLTVDYLKQEALDPLKGLGRFLLWGVAGSLAIAVGILLLLVGVLRLLQTETGTALTGNWSWVPYFAVGLIGLVVVAAAVWRITAGPAKRKLPKDAKATTTTPTPTSTPTSTATTPPLAPATARGAAGHTSIGLGEPTTAAIGNDEALGKLEGSS